MMPDAQALPGLIVWEIAGSRAVVSAADPVQATDLRSIGFMPEGERLVKALPDDAACLAVVALLIGLDAAFVSGHGWSPDELVRHYREQGRIDRPHVAIAWTGPGRFWVVRITRAARL